MRRWVIRVGWIPRGLGWVEEIMLWNEFKMLNLNRSFNCLTEEVSVAKKLKLDVLDSGRQSNLSSVQFGSSSEKKLVQKKISTQGRGRPRKSKELKLF